MAVDPVTVVNLLFCIVIIALGYLGYKKTDNALPLYIGAAFGLFGISHLAVIVGFESSAAALIAIRGIAYIIVIFALYMVAFKR